jgi:hypothetical protein
VDSLYLYNFVNHRPHPLCQEDRNILGEIGDPGSIRLRDKHYFLLPNSKSDLADEPRPLPMKLSTAPEGHSVTLVVGDDLKAADAGGYLKEVTLKLGVPGITPEADVWAVHLNGSEIPRSQQKCEADAVAFSERWIEFNLTAGPYPARGRNEIRFFLRKRNTQVKQPLELTEVELTVRYL